MERIFHFCYSLHSPFSRYNVWHCFCITLQKFIENCGKFYESNKIFVARINTPPAWLLSDAGHFQFSSNLYQRKLSSTTTARNPYTHDWGCQNSVPKIEDSAQNLCEFCMDSVTFSGKKKCRFTSTLHWLLRLSVSVIKSLPIRNSIGIHYTVGLQVWGQALEDWSQDKSFTNISEVAYLINFTTNCWLAAAVASA